MLLQRSRLFTLLMGQGGTAARMPLDGTTPAAAYSMRRLLTAYTGALVRLRRDSDNAESDFGYAATGEIDAAAVAAWLGGANGFVVTWYDQSGNGYDVTQATTTAQPTYAAAGINSKPALTLGGAAYLKRAAGVPAGTAGGIFVAHRHPATSQWSCLISSDDEANGSYYIEAYISNGRTLRFRQRANDTNDVVDTSTAMTVNTNYVTSFLSDGAAYVLRTNGADEALTVSAGVNSGDWFGDTDNRDNLIIGAKQDTSVRDYAKSTIREVIIYATSLAAGAITTIEQAMASDIGLTFAVVLPVIGVLGFTYASTVGLA